MNKVYKTILSVAATAIIAGAVITPAVTNAWGDSNNGRASYTISQINEGVLGDTITFNSISDGKIGNEKNFVGARVSSSASETWNADAINVRDGEVYTVRLYVHNNNPEGYNAVAKNVTAQFAIPTTIGKTQTVVGYLNSSNATPNRYWDEVKFTSSENFYLEYLSGSAKYTNAKMGTVSLSDNVIINGATLGYESLNGEIPGCYEYDGVVTIQVKAHKATSAKLAKTVRIKGSGESFSEAVEAEVGDTVEFQIEYVNLSDRRAIDVMIRDVLPTNMTYVQNSTYLYNSNYRNGVKLSDNTVTTTGINIGNYNANGNAYVRFSAKVVDKSLECGQNQLVNWASATVDGDVFKDDASVFVEDLTCEDRGDEPTNPGTPETPTTPETKPQTPTTETTGTIVSTGSAEVAGAAVGAGSLVTALGYYIASRKKLM
ncbi:MAG: hypothetical protein Q4B65_00710 [Candidatus Saccharibacteria bacterium]|nr:hypothetical protein [Candidatus Saccharibacteria bacterium]